VHGDVDGREPGSEARGLVEGEFERAGALGARDADDHTGVADRPARGSPDDNDRTRRAGGQGPAHRGRDDTVDRTQPPAAHHDGGGALRRPQKHARRRARHGAGLDDQIRPEAAGVSGRGLEPLQSHGPRGELFCGVLAYPFTDRVGQWVILVRDDQPQSRVVATGGVYAPRHGQGS
jgi:hypothetical protein